MPNLVGIGLSQVPTNSMLGGLAYQDPEHASIKDLDLKNLSQINSEIADTATDIFIYDTSKDSDGGAWRKRTTHTSWYNETLGTATRGSRREFPAVAVLVLSANKLTIYDGDDPDLSMWMDAYQFVNGGSSGNTTNWHGGSGTFSSVAALNGTIVCGATGGCRNLHFINDRMSLFYTPASGNYTQLGGISTRNDSYNYWGPSDSYYAQLVAASTNDVAMTVLPNAPIDDATSLPVPTIAVATTGGTSIIKDDGTVVDMHTYNHGYVAFDDAHNLIVGRGDGPILYGGPIPSADITETSWRAQSDVTYFGPPTAANIDVYTSTYDPGDVSALTKNAFGYDTTLGRLVKFDLNTSNANSTMVDYATTSYNTGWMHGDIKGAFLSDTVTEKDGVNYALTADKGNTNRLSSETFANGATSWQMVDNAGTANGYVVVEFKGLTVGQTYKISMTWDNNAALDSGYQHRVAHKNGTADENDTNFTHWNKTNGSSETLTGVFTAQSVNNDDLVIYANAITLNVSNFSVVETDDADGTSLIANGNFSANTTGAFTTVGGGTAAVTGGLLKLTDTSGSFCYASAPFTTVIGDQYFVTVDIVNNSNTANANYIRCGNSHNGTELHNTNYGTSYGTKTFYFTATATTTYLTLISGNGVGETGHWDNVFVYKLDNDRSVNTKGLQPYGSITKSAVATGADLVSYGPFSTSNRLRQPYNSDLNFETNDFSIIFWMYNTGSTVHQTLVGRDNREFSVDILDNANYDRKFRIYSFDSGNSLQTFDSNADPFPLNNWTHVCVNYTGGNTVAIYVNGVLNKTGTLNYDIDDTSNGLNIGCRNTSGSYAYAANATKLALVRISGSAPSAEQISKMYNDEKHLYRENAKATLYGSSDAVTALAYDEVTDRLHVGTSSGRSDFQGLRRINNTTTAVTTAISAHDEFIIEQ